MRKHQTPASKLQRTSNSQVTEQPLRYKIGSAAEWVIREEIQANSNGRHAFDLEERTAKFGEAIIRFARKVPRNPTNDRLINQLVGAGTSVGANYCEANEGVSKRDFPCSIGRCKKEAKETRFFLRMIATSEPSLAVQARVLYREANELTLIFASIFRGGN